MSADAAPRGGEARASGASSSEGSPAPARVVVERVYARDDAGPEGRSRGTLAGCSLALSAGVHAVLGTPEDGTIALLEVITGARAPLRGRALVAGHDPSRSPQIRARVGSLGLSRMSDPAWMASTELSSTE